MRKLLPTLIAAIFTFTSVSAWAADDKADSMERKTPMSDRVKAKVNTAEDKVERKLNRKEDRITDQQERKTSRTKRAKKKVKRMANKVEQKMDRREDRK